MITVLAIDPGPNDSAYVLIDQATRAPLSFGKTGNEQLLVRLRQLWGDADVVALEMVASYGMAVGAEVFETCVWTGRFQQVAFDSGAAVTRVKRLPVKLHLCHDSKAKDSNVTQALVDRFAPGQPNHGKGTKAAPGWFYGFKADVWQAYALAVYVADTTPVPTDTPSAAGAGTPSDARHPSGEDGGERPAQPEAVSS